MAKSDKLSYADWVRVYKQDDINKDQMKTLGILGAATAGFIANPVLGITIGVGGFAARHKMDIDRIEAWKAQYQEYLKE